MPLSPEGEVILQSIFAIGNDRSLGLGKRLRVRTPGAPELYALCELLARRPKEEELQLFLEQHVGFLTGLLGTPDNSDLAVLFKPPIGTQYRADFCVLQYSQGGSMAHLFEIETSHEAAFIQNGAPSKRLAYALKQLEDWRILINSNPVQCARDLVRQAQAVPLLGEEVAGSRGVRLTDPDRIRQAWDAFGGFVEPYFSYTLLIGRWSLMSDSEKARWIDRNRHGGGPVRMYTYEQLARLANFRLERDEWHDENQSWERPTE
jgi:hypothetical protein